MNTFESRRRLFVPVILGLVTAVAAAQETAPETQPEKPQTAPPTKTQPDDKENAMAYVHVKSSMGDMVFELNREKAPISVANFLSYVEKEYYNGTIFHRVIPNFMVQGGGFTADMQQKPTDKPIKNEWQNGLKNDRGTLAMARTNVPDSATSQFFINVVDNGFLDQARDGAAYAVFGKVVAGMDVVDKIKVVPTTTRPPHANVPVEPVLLETVREITADEAKKFIAEDKKAVTPE